MMIMTVVSMNFAKGNTEKQDGDRLTITWWVEYTDVSMIDGIKKYIIDPFEAANPGIKIDFQGKGDYDRVLQTALATGQGPDIFNTNGPAYSMQFAIDGLAADLTNYAVQYNWSKNVMKWALDACRYQNKLYSVPVTTETCFLFYNKDMFKANGWNPPTNFTEFLALCDKIMAKGIMPFSFGAQDFKPANEWWTTIAWNQYAGRDNVAKALRGELPWNSPIMVESIVTLNNLWQKGYITNKRSHEITGSDMMSLFGEEKAAMLGWATWLIKFIPKYAKFEYGFVPWPTWRDGVSNDLIVGIGSCLAVNSRTSDAKKNAAAKFLNFMVEDKNRAADISVALNGEFWIPMVYDLADFPPETDPLFLDTIKRFNNIPPDSPGLSMWTFWPPEFETYIYENIERVYLGQITPQKFLDDGVPIFNRELKAGKVPPIPGR
jgi:raffinose/stachyose/melibiose transport system substrate-binding protein